MIMQEDIMEKLDKHDLRKTIIRKDVLKIFVQAEGKALSSKDIEQALENPDRITLYRTLRSFEEKGLIHQAVDGSGTSKYALCSEDCTVHEHQDDHAHFHCTKCEQTICLETGPRSPVNVPEGYIVRRSYLVLEGLCRRCANP